MESRNQREERIWNRRDVLALMILGGMALGAPPGAAFAAGDCPPGAGSAGPGAVLLDRYVAAVNAHDTSSFPDLFTESYIQHSGRSPSGLAAQIETFRRIIVSMPDVQMRVEDRIIAGDKVVARNTYSATHTQPIRGIPHREGRSRSRHRYLACGEQGNYRALGILPTPRSAGATAR
jgi:predicted ester cyclase